MSQPSSQPLFQTPSPSQWVSLNNVQALSDYTGKAISNLLDAADSLRSSQYLENSYSVTQHQPTWSELEEQPPTMLGTALSSSQDMESSPSSWGLPAEETLAPSSSPSSLDYERDLLFVISPKTPITMMSSYDTEDLSPTSLDSLYPKPEIPLSIQLLSYIGEIQERVSPAKRSLALRGVMSRLLENGGITIKRKPQSFWTTLAEAYVNLVNSSDGLTDIRYSLKQKAPFSAFSPTPGLSPLTYSRQIGGVIRQQEKLAETLYGDALQNFISTELAPQERSLMTYYQLTDFDPDLVI